MTTPEQRGRSNQRAGKKFQRDCALALRKLYWPHADVIPSHERGDVGGCGDVNVECKATADWRDLAAHIMQSIGNAESRGLTQSLVWKKRVGYTDPMDGYIVLNPRVWWELWHRVERLEGVDAEMTRLLGRIAYAANIGDGAA